MSLVVFGSDFPNTKKDPFLATSPITNRYNCIAWAFGDNTRWYWPDPATVYYWPEEIEREITIEAFINLFRLKDYEVCEDGRLERGYEKIVIYCDENNIPTHAARQLPNGFWTSKLGPNIDIQHSLFSMEDGFYGNASVFMKRTK